LNNYTCNILSKEKTIETALTLWDTAGADDNKGMRTLNYANTDIFMIVFAIDNKESYNHAC